jgi:hypothetical protein
MKQAIHVKSLKTFLSIICLTQVLKLSIITEVSAFYINTEPGNSGAVLDGTFSYENNFPDTTKSFDYRHGYPGTFKEYDFRGGNKNEKKNIKNIFVNVRANKTSCYIGEPILVTYKLYSSLRSNSRITKQPVLDGFAFFDLLENVSINETVEKYENRFYKVHLIREAKVVPLQAGTLELDPIELESNIHLNYTNQSSYNKHKLNEVVDQLLKEELDMSRPKTIAIKSNSISILARPLPEENRPTNFKGAIGRFSIYTQISSNKIKINNSAILTVEIRGEGYLPLVDAPSIKWPLNIDSFSLHSTEKSEIPGVPLKGTKVFEYAFIPMKEGKYVIPAISFSYFDPLANTFKTTTSPPLGFEVTAGIKTPEAVKKLNSRESLSRHDDIHPEPGYLRGYYLFVWANILLFLIVIYLYIKDLGITSKQMKTKLFNKLSGLRKHSKVELIEEKPDLLQKARNLFHESEFAAFYKELNSVMWDVLIKKLNLPLSELTKNNISLQLKTKGWSGEMLENLHFIIDKCERNIYISSYQIETDQSFLLEKAEQVLTDLQET